jgi:hypothetical protein
MPDQSNDVVQQREQLLKVLYECEKMLEECPIQRFGELRNQIKQAREKLRTLNKLEKG